MIESWRARWGWQFPLLFVQLPGFAGGGDGWPVLREAQAQTLSIPNTGMAVALDLGEANNIHPKNKQEVGRRLALVALRQVYDKPVVAFGPTVKNAWKKAAEVMIAFETHSQPLAAEGELKGFEIAGPDGQFYPADAAIVDEQTIVVKHPNVTNPQAVRYGWAAYPDANLKNAAGLPAEPFRMDGF